MVAQQSNGIIFRRQVYQPAVFTIQLFCILTGRFPVLVNTESGQDHAVLLDVQRDVQEIRGAVQ
jgi:hypothetical protein